MYKLPYPQVLIKIAPLLSFYKEDLVVWIIHNDWYAIKQKKLKPNQRLRYLIEKIFVWLRIVKSYD